MNKLIFTVLALIIVVGGAFFLSKNSNETAPTIDNTSGDISEVVATTTNSSTTQSSNPSGTQNTVTEKFYTLAQISEHKDALSCWTTIEGKVYDVTSFVSKHPGGNEKILKVCGKDGTSLFEGQHGGQSQPQSVLASFYVGLLVK